MVVTLDLPATVVAQIDALVVKRPAPPKWPFNQRAVKFSQLSYKQQHKLETYQRAMRAFSEYPRTIKPARGSRSAVATELLCKALNIPIPERKYKKRFNAKPEEQLA